MSDKFERIVPVGGENIEVLAGLFSDVFSDEPWLYVWMTPERALKYFRDLLATPNFRGYALFDGDRAVAACLGIVSDCLEHPLYEIREFFVARQSQGKGAGSALLSRAEELLAAEGVSTFTLLTQRSLPAFGFYEKNGYKSAAGAVYMCKSF